MLIEDLGDLDLVTTAKRFLAQRKAIETAYENATTGHVEKVETEERIRRYWHREQEHWAKRPAAISQSPHTELGIERVIGMQNNLLSIEFLEAGQTAARAVGMLDVAGMEFGTGFLIGNGLLLTNHHVIKDTDTATVTTLFMNKEANRFGDPKQEETFELEPDRFFLTNAALDFTAVAVCERSDGDCSIEEFGYHPLISREGKILIGQPVNLIQHPGGRIKSICVHDSRFMFLENDGEVDPFCWYSSDTEPGSSGSPVFNNRWEVVALHHKAIPKVDQDGNLLDRDDRPISKERAKKNPEDLVWVANEGIRASRLVRAIEGADLPPAFASERQALLALWAKPRAQSAGLESARRRPERLADTSKPHENGTASAVQVTGQPGFPITINVNIRNGSADC